MPLLTGSRMIVELGTELSNVSIGNVIPIGVGVGVATPPKAILPISNEAATAKVILFQFEW